MNSTRSYVLSSHAITEMQRRGISESQVAEVMESSDSTQEIRPGRLVCQKVIKEESGKVLLYRVFLDVDRLPNVVVTAYRTSKIAKYEIRQ